MRPDTRPPATRRSPSRSPRRGFIVARAVHRLGRLAAEVASERRREDEEVARQLDGAPLAPLVVLTLNLQFFASFPRDRAAGVQKLKEALRDNPPDVICVQEGLAGFDVLRDLGYELAVCAGERRVAQSVREMVYNDVAALKMCKQDQQDELLCNQLYMRIGSSWAVEEDGVEQISSANMDLAGGGGRVSGKLAVRSMAWLKLCRSEAPGPAAFVMCTHITGGRFEDQYFAQQLAEERYRQTKHCSDFFHSRRPGAQADDVGILVGDYNATTAYADDGPMHDYFKFGIAGSKGVWSDASSAGIETEEDLESGFKKYMVSPFQALQDSGWTPAYGEEVGATSMFGHVVDHMALSRPVTVKSAEIVYLTNQRVQGKPPDTDVAITDHNAVKVTFEF